MKLKIDHEADALYLTLDESEVVDSEEVSPGIIVDYNAENNVMGIEMLYLSKRTPKLNTQKLEFETCLNTRSLLRKSTGCRCGMMAVGVGIHHQLQHQVAHGKTTPQGALRGLVQAGLIEQHGASWWTYYRLKIPRELPEQKVPQADEDKILAYVREHGTINNTECRELLSVDLQRASYLLKRMTAEETLKREGERRWARYRLP